MSQSHLAWLLVTKHSNVYKRQRFLEEAPALGIDLREVDPSDFYVVSKSGANLLFSKQTDTPLQKSELPAFVISLAVVEQKDSTAFRLIEHLEYMGIPTLNSVTGTKMANDKMASYQVAAKTNLLLPQTMLVLQDAPLEKPDFLQFPLVIKPNQGLKGKGVELLKDHTDLTRYAHEHATHEPLILQEAIMTSAGRDVRLLVLGDHVLGALERKSDETFTSNVATGGTGSTVSVPETIQKAACTLARALDLSFCSVDFLYGENSLIFCEINAGPGFAMFEKTTKINVANEVLSYLKNR